MHPNHDVKTIIINDHASQQEELQLKVHPPSKMLIAMFIYLYLIQGVIVSFGATMPYIYTQLPNYEVMSIFTSVALPFSFKFLTAPITQKINFTMYGKRKTWIIISQIATSICLYLASFYTTFQKAHYFALILIGSMFFISLQDISLDCLAMKQLKIPHFVSMISTVANMFGSIFGSLILLKLTSKQFALKFGIQHPITEVSLILKIVSTIILVTAVIVHIYFKQTVLQMQKQVHKKSFCEVLCYYRVFVNPKTKYFRLVSFFLIYYQGFNFFNAGYDYELVQAGFSRDLNNTINNIVIVPISLMACLLSAKIQKFGLVKSTLCSQIIIIAVRVYLLAYFPLRVDIIFVLNFIVQFAYTWQYLITGIMINILPIFGVSGMLFTVLASACNFGEQKGLHTILISIFGWKSCAVIGITIQLIIIFSMPKLYEWIDNGSVQIQVQIAKKQTQKQTFEDTDNLFDNENTFDSQTNIAAADSQFTILDALAINK